MWLLLSVVSSVMAAITVIMEKKSASETKIIQVSAVNNTGMLMIVCLTLLVTGGMKGLASIPASSVLITALSGVVQAFSWIFYFIGIRDAQVNLYMALDKFNIAATMLFCWILVGEAITSLKIAGVVMILVGALLMAETGFHMKDLLKKENRWIIYGIISPTLQALTNTLAKFDTAEVDTNLTTGIRLLVVVVVLWVLSLVKEGAPDAGIFRNSNMRLIFLAGITMGVSYMFMYRAIWLGDASVVAAIVKAESLMVAAFAAIFLREKLSAKGAVGLILGIVGTFIYAM